MDDGRLHRSGLRIIDGGRDNEVRPTIVDRLPVHGDSWLLRFSPMAEASPLLIVDADVYAGLSEDDIEALAVIWARARARGRAL